MMKKVPRYSEFRPASRSASETKKRNRSRDTKAEMLLRRALWRRDLRYRLHDRSLPGKPDVIFRRAKLVIFCDGDFWHGRNWPERRAKLEQGSNPGYWIPKIEANIHRDHRNTHALEEQGWTVLRFWETEILEDVEGVAERIELSLGKKILSN